MKEDHPYISEKYTNLLKGLNNVDTNYSQTKNLDQKVILAKNSITLWNDYITNEYNNLSKDVYQVNESTRYNMKEIFDRYKNRNKSTLPAEELIGFHYEFAKNNEFHIPIHNKNIATMLHPHWGYLCKFTNKEYTFNEIIDFYHYEFVSSYYRELGRV
jgi:hypothetical protein